MSRKSVRCDEHRRRERTFFYFAFNPFAFQTVRPFSSWWNGLWFTSRCSLNNQRRFSENTSRRSSKSPIRKNAWESSSITKYGFLQGVRWFEIRSSRWTSIKAWQSNTWLNSNRMSMHSSNTWTFKTMWLKLKLDNRRCKFADLVWIWEHHRIDF